MCKRPSFGPEVLAGQNSKSSIPVFYSSFFLSSRILQSLSCPLFLQTMCVVAAVINSCHQPLHTTLLPSLFQSCPCSLSSPPVAAPVVISPPLVSSVLHMFLLSDQQSCFSPVSSLSCPFLFLYLFSSLCVSVYSYTLLGTDVCIYINIYLKKQEKKELISFPGKEQGRESVSLSRAESSHVQP